MELIYIVSRTGLNRASHLGLPNASVPAKLVLSILPQPQASTGVSA